MVELEKIAEYLQTYSELLLIKAERQLHHLREVCNGNATCRDNISISNDIPPS